MPLKKKKLVTAVFILIIAAIVIGFVYFAIKNHREHYFEYSTVFEGDENTYYRIPGVIVTESGTLIAYCEERSALSDTSDMNIVYKRSTDNGKTWEEEVVLVDGISTGHTMNNPIMIADDEGGVHCIYTVDYGLGEEGGLYYVYSDDDGLSWSEPENITEITEPENWYRIASGPGHGIQLSNGILIATVWMTEPTEEELTYQDDQYYIATIYSEDYGKTWQFGETLKSNDSVTGPGEAAIVELSDGTVMINARIVGEQQYRAIAYSDTGYSDWTELITDENLKDPGCFGSIVSAGNALLFVNNNSQTARENLLVRISYDDGTTWSTKKIVRANDDDDEQKYAGYADLAVNSKGLVYTLYEECEDDIYSIKLCRFYIEYTTN